MTIRRHHTTEWEGEHPLDCMCDRSPECRGVVGPMTLVWYEDAEENPHVYFGIRGNPPDPPEVA